MAELTENKNDDMISADDEYENIVKYEIKDGEEAVKEPERWRDSVYVHFSTVPVKVLDCFIALCVVALIAVITVGVMRSKGLL